MSSGGGVKFQQPTTQQPKCLAFHPYRPWLLVGFMSGQVEIWDFRTHTLVQSYHDASGPIRGVQWHPTQSIFATGSDDQLVRVYNYQQKRLIFELTGHLDYIRSLSFHHEQPWILTSSDDETARVWNWQSRQCICVLLGHTYYITSAQFHPKYPLIITTSLDKSARVWDYSSLLQQQNGGGALLSSSPASLRLQGHMGSSHTASLPSGFDTVMPDVDLIHVINSNEPMTLSTWFYVEATDTTYIFLCGLINGNSISPQAHLYMHSLSGPHFHLQQETPPHVSGSSPLMPIPAINSMVASQHGDFLMGNVDGTVKMFTPNISASGQYSYPSCSTFMSAGQSSQGDACISVALHPIQRLFAGGFDHSLCIWKGSRERIGFGVLPGTQSLIWMARRQIIASNVFSTPSPSGNLTKDVTIPIILTQNHRDAIEHAAQQVPGPAPDPMLMTSTTDGSVLTAAPAYVRSFYVNQHSASSKTSQMLFTKNQQWAFYALNHVTANGRTTTSVQNTVTGNGRAAVFASSSRFVVLESERLAILNFNGEVKRVIQTTALQQQFDAFHDAMGQSTTGSTTPAAAAKAASSSSPLATINAAAGSSTPVAKPPQSISPGPPGFILVRFPDAIGLYDINTTSFVGSIHIQTSQPIKSIVWNSKYTVFCIQTKSTLILISCDQTTRTLTYLTTHHETSSIKSVIFDSSPTGDVVIFNTPTHLKYMLLNGHVSVLKTLSDVIYISHISSQISPVSQELLDHFETLTNPAKNALLNKYLSSASSTTALVPKSTHSTGTTTQRFRSPLVPFSPYDRYLHLFTRHGQYQVLRINAIEIIFKQALLTRQTSVIAQAMCHGSLQGEGIVQYVCQRGYWDLALHLITDKQTKFSICVQAGRFSDALQCAQELDNPTVWSVLSTYSLYCGQVNILEQIFVFTKNIPSLSFLYLLTGQVSKISKMVDFCLNSYQRMIENRLTNGTSTDSVNTTIMSEEEALKHQQIYEFGLLLGFVTSHRREVLSSLLYTAASQSDPTIGLYHGNTNNNESHTNGNSNITGKNTLTDLQFYDKPTLLSLLYMYTIGQTNQYQQQQSQYQYDSIEQQRIDASVQFLSTFQTQTCEQLQALQQSVEQDQQQQQQHNITPSPTVRTSNTPLGEFLNIVGTRPSDSLASHLIDVNTVAKYSSSYNEFKYQQQQQQQQQNVNIPSVDEFYQEQDDFISSLFLSNDLSIYPQQQQEQLHTAGLSKVQYIGPAELLPIIPSQHNAFLTSPYEQLPDEYHDTKAIPSSSWPLVPIQQVTQLHAHLSVDPITAKLNNASSAAIAAVSSGTGQNPNDQLNEDDWFREVLSHAQGLTKGSGTTTGSASTFNPTSTSPTSLEAAHADELAVFDTTNPASPQPATETWDLDELDLPDADPSDSALHGIDAVMAADDIPMDSDLSSTGQPFCFATAQLLSLPPEPSPIQRWGYDLPDHHSLVPLRQLYAQNLQASSQNFEIQLAPSFSFPQDVRSVIQSGNTEQFSHDTITSTLASNNMIKIAVETSLQTQFALPPPYLSLSHVVNPPSAQWVPLQVDLVDSTSSINTQQQNNNNKLGGISRSLPVPICPITPSTLFDRYRIAITLTHQGFYAQARDVLRTFFHIFPFVSTTRLSLHRDEDDDMMSATSTTVSLLPPIPIVQFHEQLLSCDPRILFSLLWSAREYYLWLSFEHARVETSDQQPQHKAIYAQLSNLCQLYDVTALAQQHAQLLIKAKENISSSSTTTTTWSSIELPNVQHTPATLNFVLMTLWLSCKYLFPLQQFASIATVCRRILYLLQQHNDLISSPLFVDPLSVNTNLVQRMLAKAQSSGNADKFPTLTYIDTSGQQLQYDAVQSSQIVQQTQHIGQSPLSIQITHPQNIIAVTNSNTTPVTTMLPILHGAQLAVCSASLTPFVNQQAIAQNAIMCSCCHSLAQKQYLNTQCAVCSIGTYGADATGLSWETFV